MIVWGGTGGTDFSDGSRFNIVTGTWAATAGIRRPISRGRHTAVWTGGEMFIWGGDRGAYVGDNRSYSPARIMFLYLKL